MSTHNADRKGRRKRKTRTKEVSAAPSSERSNWPSPPPLSEDRSEMQQNKDNDITTKQSNQAHANGDIDTLPPAQISGTPLKTIDPEQQAFDEFYLKQATKEFANDLDKLRSASDFKEGSVSMLIAALKQGRACFTAEERARVGGAG